MCDYLTSNLNMSYVLVSSWWLFCHTILVIYLQDKYFRPTHVTGRFLLTCYNTNVITRGLPLSVTTSGHYNTVLMTRCEIDYKTINLIINYIL